MKADTQTISAKLRTLPDEALSDLDPADMTPEGEEALREELRRRRTPEYRALRTEQERHEREHEEKSEKLRRLNSRSWELSSTISLVLEISVVALGVILLAMRREESPQALLDLAMVILLIGVLGAFFSFAVSPPSILPIERFIIFLFVRPFVMRKGEILKEEPTTLNTGRSEEIEGRFAKLTEEELLKIAESEVDDEWTREAVLAARNVLSRHGRKPPNQVS